MSHEVSEAIGGDHHPRSMHAGEVPQEVHRTCDAEVAGSSPAAGSRQQKGDTSTDHDDVDACLGSGLLPALMVG